MTAAIEDADIDHRGCARRRFAALCGLVAVVLLVGGWLLSKGSGSGHDVGVAMFGYGLGIAVAAAFLASGYDPRRRG